MDFPFSEDFKEQLVKMSILRDVREGLPSGKLAQQVSSQRKIVEFLRAILVEMSRTYLQIRTIADQLDQARRKLSRNYADHEARQNIANATPTLRLYQTRIQYVRDLSTSLETQLGKMQEDLSKPEAAFYLKELDAKMAELQEVMHDCNRAIKNAKRGA